MFDRFFEMRTLQEKGDVSGMLLDSNMLMEQIYRDVLDPKGPGGGAAKGSGWEATTVGWGETTTWSADRWSEWMNKHGYQVTNKHVEDDVKKKKEIAITKGLLKGHTDADGYAGTETPAEFIQFLYDSNQIQKEMYNQLRQLNADGVLVKKQ